MIITYDNFFDQPIVLENETVRLELLQAAHFDPLLPVALNTELWRFTINKINSKEDFRDYFNTALEEKASKKSYPLALFDKRQQQYAGSTRLLNIDFNNKRLEIGSTWIAPGLHGTGFNKHCKFLLLNFCFETLLLNRVELKTNLLNLRSQKAMLKIGAVKEGIFRKHIVNDDGSIRDSVYFSFINDEWPEIKSTIFTEFNS
jgi:N-acetyltransferase